MLRMKFDVKKAKQVSLKILQYAGIGLLSLAGIWAASSLSAAPNVKDTIGGLTEEDYAALDEFNEPISSDEASVLIPFAGAIYHESKKDPLSKAVLSDQELCKHIHETEQIFGLAESRKQKTKKGYYETCDHVDPLRYRALLALGAAIPYSDKTPRYSDPKLCGIIKMADKYFELSIKKQLNRPLPQFADVTAAIQKNFKDCGVPFEDVPVESTKFFFERLLPPFYKKQAGAFVPR